MGKTPYILEMMMVIKDLIWTKQINLISTQILWELSLFLSPRDEKVGPIPTIPLDLILAIHENGDEL